MLTDERVRNGLINTAYRWPNKVVPFVIDSIFSKYRSTKDQSGMWEVERKISLSSSKHWSLSGRNNGDSYLTFPLKAITQTHTLTSSIHVRIRNRWQVKFP